MNIVETLEKELEAAKKQVSALGKALEAFRGSWSHNRPQTGKKQGRPAAKKRRMSAAARKRISDAQKARWAKQKARG
jgi:hypothetical protein